MTSGWRLNLYCAQCCTQSIAVVWTHGATSYATLGHLISPHGTRLWKGTLIHLFQFAMPWYWMRCCGKQPHGCNVSEGDWLAPTGLTALRAILRATISEVDTRCTESGVQYYVQCCTVCLGLKRWSPLHWRYPAQFSSATCDAALSKWGVTPCKRDLSNLQGFVPRKPGKTRYWRAGAGGQSDLQRNTRAQGKRCKLFRPPPTPHTQHPNPTLHYKEVFDRWVYYPKTEKNYIMGSLKFPILSQRFQSRLTCRYYVAVLSSQQMTIGKIYCAKLIHENYKHLKRKKLNQTRVWRL